MTPVSLGPPGPGTSVMQVMASDADDPTYGSSARLVYSVLDGEHHFTVDPKTGEGPGRANKGRGLEGPEEGHKVGARGVGLGRGPHRVVCSLPSNHRALRVGWRTRKPFASSRTQGSGKGQPDRKKQKGMGWRAPAGLAGKQKAHYGCSERT